MTFLTFLKILEWRTLNNFGRTQGKNLKKAIQKGLPQGAFKKLLLIYLVVKKEWLECLESANLWVTEMKPFLRESEEKPWK